MPCFLRYHASYQQENFASPIVDEPHTTHNPLMLSVEEPALKMSSSQSLYDLSVLQFNLSTKRFTPPTPLMTQYLGFLRN